jgi:hypothetical protein
MNARAILLGLAGLFVSGSALAHSDLKVDITEPAGTYVYAPAAYSVKVSNIGNKSAASVQLTIELPRTNTSPQVFVMGTLGTYSPTCSKVGTNLICNLGSIARNTFKSANFNIALPQSAAPIQFKASVTTTSLENSTSNNSDTEVADLLNYATTVLPGQFSTNEHCTGTGLVSFFECECFPSSIMSHDIQFLAGGVIEIVGQPGYSGIWWQPASDELRMEYYEGTDLVAEFHGHGVDSGCFEGLTHFPSSSYVSPYRVCPHF